MGTRKQPHPDGAEAKSSKRATGKASAARKRGAKASVPADAHEANQTPMPGAPFTVHENPMPDMDDFADEAGSDGADDTTPARISALRALLIKGEDAAKIEWRIKRQWPHLKDTAAAIVEAAQRAAAKWLPGETRIIDGMQKIITSIDALNDRFAMIEVPGQATCVAQRSDALFMSRDDFKSRMGTSVIVTGVNKDGAVQAKDAAKIWTGDNRRRTANKIVFTSRKVPPNCFNLWTGFGVRPRAGSCKLIRRHIWEVICSKDSTKYKAFVRLLSWQAQNIGCASRIVVDLQSDLQQVGKGVLLEKILRPLYGLHGAFTADSDKVFGRFNDLIRGKAYTAFDEACFAGKRDTADKIKSISATESTLIEGKNLPVIECPVAVNIFMATNHGHAAHVEWGDMRYWILKVSEHRRGDGEYWGSLREEINNGGIEAFLHNLLARNVSKFDPQRDVPRDNDEHRANKRASDPGNPALWLLECLDNGLWLGSEAWEGDYSPDGRLKSVKGALKLDANSKKLLPAFVLKAYRTWAKDQGPYIHTPPNDKFWKLLTSFGIDGKKCGGMRARVVPDEDALRAKIEEWLGTAGTVENDVTPKTDQKDALANIFPGFSGESAIRLSPTDPKAKELDKTTAYQGTVGGDSRGDSRGDGRGQETTKGGQSGTVEGTVVSAATVPASSAFKSNGKHGSNGGSGTEGDKATRGTQSPKPHQPSRLCDDGCSDFDNNVGANGHAANAVKRVVNGHTANSGNGVSKEWDL